MDGGAEFTKLLDSDYTNSQKVALRIRYAKAVENYQKYREIVEDQLLTQLDEYPDGLSNKSLDEILMNYRGKIRINY